MEATSRPTDFKYAQLRELFAQLGPGPVSVLDLGCGTCKAVEGALREHPNVSYVGVEQDAAALAQARRLIGDLPTVQLQEAFGEQFSGGTFDLVISLSVLEHVKYLDAFLETSVRAVRPGGTLMHRYDLGHALTPSTLGERLRVAVARRVPAAVPAARFTTSPDATAIVRRLGELGIVDLTVRQAQAPSLKAAMNRIDQSTPEGQRLAADVVALDARLWDELSPALKPEARDRLFPAIIVTGRRAG
ncbi:MAG: class I SAM-dependent methyltransferase [Solirubrobacteraceae bacterium]|nr:class I SAM-dependent methyltransferase [Solirubrobacteraceae bacterium]